MATEVNNFTLTGNLTRDPEPKTIQNGKKFCYVMVDRDGNEFVWITAAKAWDEDSVHLLRGTVKEHKVFRNSKQTVLSRCTEIN
jgi:hypothetical protein